MKTESLILGFQAGAQDARIPVNTFIVFFIHPLLFSLAYYGERYRRYQ